MRTIIDRVVCSCKNIHRTKLQWGLCTFKRAQTCLCSVYAAWGCSSVGRALPPQGRGRGFDSLHLHHSFSSFLPYSTCRNANILIRKNSSIALSVAKCKKACLTGAILCNNLPEKISCNKNAITFIKKQKPYDCHKQIS